MAGERTELTALPWVGHRSRAWEPEPARWAGVHGLYALYRTADRLEGRPESAGRAALAGALGRVGDVISGIPKLLGKNFVSGKKFRLFTDFLTGNDNFTCYEAGWA
jgi:hypothetical protein